MHSPYVRAVLSISLLILIVSLVSACGRAEDQPTAESLATTVEPPAAVQPVSMPGRELLTMEEAEISCDHPQDAQLACSSTSEGYQLSVDVHAGTFARWSLSLPVHSEPIPANAILRLTLERDDEVTPALYLVEDDGRRIRTNLNRFGLGSGRSTLHIPLREIRDEESGLLQVEALREIQIVFEWADMAGDLLLESMRLEETWQETVGVPEGQYGLTVPKGFAVEPVAGGIFQPTQMAIVSASSESFASKDRTQMNAEEQDKDPRQSAPISTPYHAQQVEDLNTSQELLISQQNGRIWRYRDQDGDGAFESRQLYATGFAEVVGLLYDPLDGAVWVGGRGQLWRTLDMDGDGASDSRGLRIDGLAWGRHQNNGLAWNPVQDPFSGEPAYSWVYFGLGSTEDLEVGPTLNATILRFPRDGQGEEDVEVVSRGNRNAYDVLWAPVRTGPDDEETWSLFASENGPDFNDAPDEVNHIRWGHHYGFPEQFGMVENPDDEGDPYSSPVYPAAAHASANGLAYVTNSDWPAPYRTLYVSLFGEVFSEEPVGHTVDRITLQTAEGPDGETTYRGESDVFVEGMDRPLPLTTDVDGNLLVADYASGIIYRIRYTGN